MTDDRDDDGLDELLAAMQAAADPTVPELLAQIDRARQAPPPEVTTIPDPEMVFGAETLARFRCPLQCGWTHEEPVGDGPLRVILPADWSLEDLNSALCLDAEVRALAFRTNVEQAIDEHFRQRHPEI
ncbi:hypothetical protein [Kitasatospora sp. MBT66]|uniref:hypothetical protein n=1 Tax=Kitasatospora sp. MBT66 TaxID=1444769 RepID=UPI0005B894CF|nr:hypothetical protein [Kitasatospora sp. MBT66]